MLQRKEEQEKEIRRGMGGSQGGLPWEGQILSRILKEVLELAMEMWQEWGSVEEDNRKSDHEAWWKLEFMGP